MQDRHTKRIYRLHDFSKSQPITPDLLWCVSGKVNSADKLYLVIDSVKIDSKNSPCSSNSNSCWTRKKSRNHMWCFLLWRL